MTRVTTQPLLTPPSDGDGNNSSPFQKNQRQQWQCDPELLQGSSSAVQTSHNTNHHLQLLTAPVFSDKHSDFLSVPAGVGRDCPFSLSNTNISPSSPEMGRVRFPLPRLLGGHRRVLPLWQVQRGHQEVLSQTELPSKIRLGKEALFLPLSRCWLELFHENNFASFTQM